MTVRKIVSYIVLLLFGNPSAEFEATMTPEIENRQHPRMPITLPARIITATGLIEGEMENVSLHGAFIGCKKPLEPGERLMVVVKLPSNPSFNSHAEVVWSRVPCSNDEGINCGMGVKFSDLTQTSLMLEACPPEQKAEARL